jgi:hypothetical protein
MAQQHRHLLVHVIVLASLRLLLFHHSAHSLGY